MISRRHSQETITSFLTKENNIVTPLRRLSIRIASFSRNTSRGALGCVAVAMGLFLTTAPALAAGPELNLAISHSPSIFMGGEAGSYTLTITNTGDAATSGPITVADTLPMGMTLSGVTPGSFFSCMGDGAAATPLNCTRTEPLAPTEMDSVRVGVVVAAPPILVDSEILTNTAIVSGGGAPDASASDQASVQAPFRIKTFTSRITDSVEADYTAAGGHPSQNETRFEFPIAGSEGKAVENMMDVGVDLPVGFFGNPAVAPRCPSRNITSHEVDDDCPAGSMVGTAEVFGVIDPLYNVKPDRGYPAQFAFNHANTLVTLYATLRPRTESYDLTVGSTGASRILFPSIRTTFCGYGTNGAGNPTCKASPGAADAPFLTNPVNCSDADPIWKIAADSWEHAGRRVLNGVPDLSGTPDLSDPNWKTATTPATPVTECDAPALASQFNPTIDAKPLQSGGPLQADQPSGLAVDLDFPQTNDPTDPSTTFDPSIPQAPEPKDITVKLPAGLSVSPSSADGLGACSDLASDPAGDQVHYDNVNPVTCPDSAKIGSAVATSPLLASHDPVTDAVNGAEPIGGDVYLLAPHPGDLPIGGGNQDGKFRLLIQLENERYGINFKLPGIAVADRQTGQLTTVFTENPQLPARHLQVNLFSGPRAPLATPVTCGKFDTTSDLVPWSTPGTPDAHPTSSFNVGSGPNGSACVNIPGQRTFAPTMSVGTESNKAGAASPFVLKLTRNDGEQELGSLDLTTPKGFTAKLAGVPYCSDAAIASAAGKSGNAEQSSPSCPAASQIGTITAGAGPGANPYSVGGKAYLAGPYKGASLSFAFITPAVAGPFDLGNVVVRAAVFVDPETAQVTVKTDQLPQIIDGVPLRLRSITAKIDRSNFTLNPTNCEPMSVSATVTGADGASSSPSQSFQVGSCKDLGFKPALKLSLKGGTARSDHPALKAVLNYPKGAYANIAKAVVGLPHSEFLAQNHIKTICTRVQFAAGAGNGTECPKGSVYGYATATTPLLDQPLSGPVYLRSSSNPLPDLVAALHGQIDVDLVGRIDSKSGGIRTTFDSVPDAPVSQFVLTMQGGKKGLLENSRNLCKSKNKADVAFTAQNGKTSDSTPELTNSCKKYKKHKGKHKHKHKSKGGKAAHRLLSRFGF